MRSFADRMNGTGTLRGFDSKGAWGRLVLLQSTVKHGMSSCWQGQATHPDAVAVGATVEAALRCTRRRWSQDVALGFGPVRSW